MLSLTLMTGIVSQKVKYLFVFCYQVPLSTEPLLVNLISDSSFSTKLRG